MRNSIVWISALFCGACSGSHLPAAPAPASAALVRPDALPTPATGAAPDAEVAKLAKADVGSPSVAPAAPSSSP